MSSRLILVLLVGTSVGGATLAARAADAAPPPETLPLFATLPAPDAPQHTSRGTAAAADPESPESIYHGLYFGSEVFGLAGHGIKGGVGGDVYAGYERLIGNGVLVGMEGATGYGPALLGRPGLKGFDFGEADARLAYPMGRLTPFIEAGLTVAKPVTGPGLATNTTDSFNDLVNGAGALYAAPRIGAGFAYALTSNTSVAVGVSVGRGLGAGFP